MKAILPVAGIGSRLRPHTHTTPKALVHVAGKPILGHILDALIPVGVDEVVLVVGHLGSKIVDYVRKAYDVRVHVVEQTEPKGLGHAIYVAQTAVNPPEPILIVLGDTVFQADLKPALEKGISTIGVAQVDDPRNFGVVQLEGERIVRLVEKPQQPPSNLAIVGVYYLRDSSLLYEALEHVVTSGIRSRGEIQLTDALQVMVDRGELMTTFPVDEWLDCGSPESLLETNRRLLEQQSGAPPQVRDGVIVIPPVYIAPSAKVTHSIIGPHVSIADDAIVHRSVVRNSIVNQGALVEEILLADSIIGERAAVGGNYARLNVGDSSELRMVR